MCSAVKDMKALLKQFPSLYMTRSKKHIRVVDHVSGDYIIASATPSCKRHMANFKSDVRKLAHGCGYKSRNLKKFEDA